MNIYTHVYIDVYVYVAYVRIPRMSCYLKLNHKPCWPPARASKGRLSRLHFRFVELPTKTAGEDKSSDVKSWVFFLIDSLESWILWSDANYVWSNLPEVEARSDVLGATNNRPSGYKILYFCRVQANRCTVYIHRLYIYIEETILTRMTSWFQIVSAVLWVHKLADPQ